MIMQATAQAFSKDAAMGVLSQFICDLTKLPLETAVTTSCGCKVNEVAARELFGPMLKQDSCEKSASCPLCSRQVTAYYPDTPIREVVREFYAGFPFGIENFKKKF